MNFEDSELLVRIAGRDPRALEDLYDRHARSVYGYALAITRRPLEARRTLVRTFETLARGPETASAAASLRRHLLWLARPIAWAERSRRRLRLPRRRSAYALDPDSSAELVAELGEAADEDLLQAVEGLRADQLEEKEPEASPPAPARLAWRPPPRSIRPLVLSRAREAARPGRRYARWLLSWALLVGAILLAIATDVATPRLPRVRTVPPLKEELRVRRHLHWILEGFRQEERP